MLDLSHVSSLLNQIISSISESSWANIIIICVVAPIIAAVLLYNLSSFDPAHLPADAVTNDVVAVPLLNPNLLEGSEKVGEGKLICPEDIDYDPKSGLLYTGCNDGWIKRFSADISAPFTAVDNFANTEGRPMGLVLGHNNDVFVADGVRGGLLRVSEDGKVEMLTDEAEGIKFGIIDGVDLADDGILYFTDASTKYGLQDFMWDHLEGRPHGRVCSYDPRTKETKVVMKDLYFPNGILVSADQTSILVGETSLRRLKRIYIKGEKKGTSDIFIDKLPGLPDSIRYDKEGHYWIAISTEHSYRYYLMQKYLVVRKLMALWQKYKGPPGFMAKNGGALAVDLEGKPTAYFHDPNIALIASVLKVGDYLYCGNVMTPYMIRLNASKYPAVPIHQLDPAKTK